MGASAASILTASGEKVALLDGDTSAIDRAGPGAVFAETCDLTTDEGRPAVERALAALGGLDLLVFTVGRPWSGNVLIETGDAFYDVLRAPVLSLLQVARAAREALRASKGTVAVVTGADARSPERLVELWGVASACVQSLAKCLAHDLAADGVRVFNVAIHGVRTGSLDRVLDELEEGLRIERADVEELLGRRRLSSAPTPDEVAQAIIALADRPLIGATITLDGGAAALHWP